MPLQMCSRCNHIHYVPGDCVTEARVVNGSLKREAVTPLPKPTTKKSPNKAPAADAQLEDGKRSDKRSEIVAEGSPRAPKASAAPDGGRTSSRAKATKGKTAKVGATELLETGKADAGGVASRVSGGAGTAALVQAEAAAAHLKPAKKRGRPKGSTDRKAYQRELMRKRRAAKPHP